MGKRKKISATNSPLSYHPFFLPFFLEIRNYLQILMVAVFLIWTVLGWNLVLPHKRTKRTLATFLVIQLTILSSSPYIFFSLMIQKAC